MKVFISYSSKDGKQPARKLSEVLERRGHDPYLAEHHGLVSEVIWDEIAEEIEKRELGIFLITESSLKSKGQKVEYRLVAAKYKNRMAFVSERASEMRILDCAFPLLAPYRRLVFNDSNLEESCERIATQLVRLQDKESSVQETEINQKERLFPKLELEGLDKDEVSKCIESLSESYQMETIIPEAFGTQDAEKLDGFMNIGFNYRLPREWFLSYDETHTVYSNEFMFGQFGRSIALGERAYLNDQVISNDKALHVVEGDSSPESAIAATNEAISLIGANGFKPKIIFPTINHYMEFHRLSRAGKAHLKFSNVVPKPRLDASLITDGIELKLIAPLGQIPNNTIVFGDRAVRWHIKRQPKHGSLFIEVGNDTLYPKRYVQVIARTTARCEIATKGIVIIKVKSDGAKKPAS